MLPCQQAEVIELEAVVEEVHEGFQSLDQQMSRAGQTATKIGDRLQVERKIFCASSFHTNSLSWTAYAMSTHVDMRSCQQVTCAAECRKPEVTGRRGHQLHTVYAKLCSLHRLC